MGVDPMLGAQFMPKPKGPLVLSKGARAFDDSGREIAANPEIEKPESKFAKVNPADYTPDSFRKFAVSGNYAELVPYRKPDKPDTPNMQSITVGDKVYTFNPKLGQYTPAALQDGSPIAKSSTEKPLTESQGTASLYLGMMKKAEDAITASKFDPTTVPNQTLLAFARGDIPKLPKAFQNGIASGPAQRYAQGMYQWTEAMLRATTGATAPPEEVWRTAKTFFPMPLDKPDTVKQKSEQRASMQQLMRIKAGHGAGQVDAATQGVEDPLGIR